MLFIALFLLFGALAAAIANSRASLPMWVSFLLGAVLGPVGVIVISVWPAGATKVPDNRSARSAVRSVGYWALVAGLAVIGFLGVFTIGLPFLLLAVVLAALAPYRHRAIVFWPGVLAVPTFVTGFVLIAPLGCSSSSSMNGNGVVTAGRTTCTNLIGIDYSANHVYSPSLLPALGTGLVLAVTEVAGVRRYILNSYKRNAAAGVGPNDS